MRELGEQGKKTLSFASKHHWLNTIPSFLSTATVDASGQQLIVSWHFGIVSQILCCSGGLLVTRKKKKRIFFIRGTEMGNVTSLFFP